MVLKMTSRQTENSDLDEQYFPTISVRLFQSNLH